MRSVLCISVSVHEARTVLARQSTLQVTRVHAHARSTFINGGVSCECACVYCIHIYVYIYIYTFIYILHTHRHTMVICFVNWLKSNVIILVPHRSRRRRRNHLLRVCDNL